ncbi:molecular chaperone SurA [Ottowia sp. GY511]|uniref:Chaperone SurA n=1 Tax=Ottowia flava TaxID=2675430 RepID=A0ABW4KV09_9BURK|nr:peptidylprolyl isomerase [Ottowia sp. GY511]TXK32947.1 molecular chaperone SurA [Ottowia sp. GY511]
MTKTSRSFRLQRLAARATLPLLCAALAIPAHAQSTDSASSNKGKTQRAAPKAAAKPAPKRAAKPAAKAAKKPATSKPAVTPAKPAPAASSPAAAGATPAAAAATTSAAPREADYIVAVVNSEPVTNNEVRARAARAAQQLSERGVPTPPTADLRKEVLERLISERAQLQYARETGIKVDDAALEQAELAIARQNELKSIDELHRQVQQQMGITVKDFRDDIRNQVTLARLREREVEPKLKVTDSEVDAFIREQTGVRAPGQDINLAMILVAVPEGANAAERTKLQQRADDVARRAKAGEDFAKLATEFSDANNRGRDGGVLGLRSADKYPELFVRATQRSRIGDIVGPLKSDAGFHVIKVLERKRNNDLPEVRIPQTHAHHILLKVGANQSERVARDRAADMRRRILAKQADFETVARENSQDESAAEGGDLGWVSPGQFVPEFEQAMNNLDPGQISPPIVTRFGVHLIRVDERTERTLSSDEQRQLARNMLREKKAQESFDTWAREVRGRAYVEYRDPPR